MLLTSSVRKRDSTVSDSILVSAEGISGWLPLWALVLSLAIEALIIDSVNDFADDMYVEAVSKYLSTSGLSVFCYHRIHVPVQLTRIKHTFSISVLGIPMDSSVNAVVCLQM